MLKNKKLSLMELMKSIGTTEEEKRKLESYVTKIIGLISKPDELKGDIKEQKEEALLYASTCILVSEILDIEKTHDWKEISYDYMVKIRERLYKRNYLSRTSVFGGLPGIGYGVYALSKATGYYGDFSNSLNKLIVSAVKEDIDKYYKEIGNISPNYYDVISGLSGTLNYLLLFKQNDETKEVIIEIIKYLIKMCKDIEVFGEIVPGWYIPKEKQFLEKEKLEYEKGNFNMGISHGIAGVLAALSIALTEDIEVDGQRQTIKKITDEFKKFHIIYPDGNIYWSGRIQFEEYFSNKTDDKNIRASWCYGTPGIARALYLAGKALKDKECIEISTKAIEGICKMDEEKWFLESPTFCHGYAGLLTIVQAMYNDTGNEIYTMGIKKIVKNLLNTYDEETALGFQDLTPKDALKGEYQLIKVDKLEVIDGTIGIFLGLLSTVKNAKTNWMKMFLLD